MPVRPRSAIVLAALVSAAACGPLRHGGPPEGIVEFDNQSLDQADVFIIRTGGAQVRIGTVMAGRRESLKIPGSAVGGDNSVNVVARILATSRAPRTGPITIAAGDRVVVTLPAQENILTVLPGREPQ